MGRQPIELENSSVNKKKESVTEYMYVAAAKQNQPRVKFFISLSTQEYGWCAVRTFQSISILSIFFFFEGAREKRKDETKNG